MNTYRIITLLLALVLIISAGAQEKFSLATFEPTTVLVQLRAEKNRIQALEKAREYRLLEMAKKDAVTIRNMMIKDFSTYVTNYKVYFFIDTNFNYIQNKQFAGVLLDSNLTPATDVTLNASSKDYMIVYYGHPAEQSAADDILTDSSRYMVNTGLPFGRGLVILNYDLLQLNYFYDFKTRFLFKSKKNKRFYLSKRFDMEYMPYAWQFNKDPFSKQRRHQVNRVKKS